MLRGTETVNLDAEDLTYVANIAKRRQDSKEDGQVESHKWTTHKTDFACNYEGVITEWATLTALGLPMKSLEEIFPRGDGGFDFCWGKYKCDAKKLSHTKQGEVLIMNPPGPKADIIIGCRIASPTCVQLVGVVSRKTFMQTKKDHDFGYGDRYYILASGLSPLDSLRCLKA